MGQYIRIRDYWGSPRFHCPACGAEVFTANGEPTEKPCEHLLFSWIDEVGEFYNTAEEIAPVIEGNVDRFFPSDDEFLAQCPDTVVLFGLESGGMACGPAGLTVVHAIRFPNMSLDCD